MMLSLKIAVAALLLLNYSVPLWVLGSDEDLRDHPMVMLVTNLTLVDFVFALVFLVMGLADVVSPEGVPLPVCASMHYIFTGMILAWKVATLFLAVDQFVAVVHSLRYTEIMSTWVNRMLVITWSCVPILSLLGLVCHQLGLESSAEFDRRVFGIEEEIRLCRWELHSHVFMLVLEMLMLLLSLITAGLFVYAAAQGMAHERHLVTQDQEAQGGFFLLRFKSFKRIVKVLFLVITIDIVGAGVRIGSRWSPGPELRVLHKLRILCIAGEGWVYGLNNPAIRRAIAKFLGCSRCGRMEPGLPEERPAWAPPQLHRAGRFAFGRCSGRRDVQELAVVDLEGQPPPDSPSEPPAVAEGDANRF